MDASRRFDFYNFKCFAQIQLTTEMVCSHKWSVLLMTVTLIMLTGCHEVSESVAEETIIITTEVSVTESAAPIIEEQTDVLSASIEYQALWSESDLQAITRTLTGECYDDKVDYKRRVCEVILNRVSYGGFGDTILEVVTAENQFDGYWNPLRQVSESDLAVAEQALKDWYENDCKMLSKNLFFNAGNNRENDFRAEF